MCGQGLPDSLHLNVRQPAIRFLSDLFLQRHGFKVRYVIDDHVPSM